MNLTIYPKLVHAVNVTNAAKVVNAVNTMNGDRYSPPSMFKCKKVTTRCIWLHAKRTPKRTSFICCIFCMATVLHLSINIGPSPPLLSVHWMCQNYCRGQICSMVAFLHLSIDLAAPPLFAVYFTACFTEYFTKYFTESFTGYCAWVIC